MGADRWSICPKCKGEEPQRTQIKNLEQELDKSYGVIARQEYNKLEQKLYDLRETLKKSHRETFSEYFEYGDFYNSPGFNVSYSGSCNSCDFTFNFSHHEPWGVE